jgi:excisionase family DNA binding protein
VEPRATGSPTPGESTLTTVYKDLPSTAIRAHIASGEHECMTAKELASWLRVDRKTVYEYAARKVIPCRRLGRRLVFLRPAIAAWLAGSSTGSTLRGVR